MPSKTKKRTQNKRKTERSRRLKVGVDTAKILRPLSEEETFYFYEDIGKSTGESARSLIDFLEKIKSVKLESLLFHLQRKDFQNWIKETLGDSVLARKIGRTPLSHDEELREKIHSTIENRVKELRETSATLLVNEDLIVASSRSTP